MTVTAESMAREAEQILEQLAAAAAGQQGEDPAILRKLAAELGDALLQARQAWPTVSLDSDVWCRYLAARLPPVEELAAALPSSRLDELYLCCGCALGDPAALEAFHQEQLPVIRQELRKLSLGPGLAEEVEQQLLMRLLVAPAGEPPVITRYGGIGRLASWLRIVTARFARKALAKEKRVVLSEDDRLAEELVVGAEADRLFAKSTYRQAFRRAFRTAVDDADPREITLLRQRYIDGLTLAEIGVVHRAHHTTVRRWLQNAYDRLLQRTHKALTESLQIPSEEWSSVIRMVQSDIDLTMHSLLGIPKDERRSGSR